MINDNNSILIFCQFGTWAGQLGDGRAHLVGVYTNRCDFFLNVWLNSVFSLADSWLTWGLLLETPMVFLQAWWEVGTAAKRVRKDPILPVSCSYSMYSKPECFLFLNLPWFYDLFLISLFSIGMVMEELCFAPLFESFYVVRQCTILEFLQAELLGIFLSFVHSILIYR